MRILGLLGQVLAAFVSAGVLAWWLLAGVMGLLLRWLERHWPLRDGRLPACALVLLLLAGAFAAIGGWLALSLLPRLLPALPDGTTGWAATLWPLVICGATWGLAGIAVAAPLGAAAAAWGSAVRRRHLTAQGAPPPRPDPLLPPGSRRIVILCDGTSNRPDQTEDGVPATTNVWKLFQALRQDETQTTWYLAGVGSDTSSTAQGARRTRRILDLAGARTGSWVASLWSRTVKLLEGATGAGISEAILKGYSEIVRQYRPGDRIYLVGFSRGGYTARCIAGVISRGGLLRAENIGYAAEVVQLYRMRRTPHDPMKLNPAMVHQDVTIEFLGVFDAVASLGAPLWGWWFRILPIWRNASFDTDPARICRHVYHALAMDERRSQFFPTLFSRPDPPSPHLQTLEQRWFRGAHADIGGGYAATGLSDIPLGWMMDAMRSHGLAFREGARAALKPDRLARAHDELSRNPQWRLFGSWPRWHPVPCTAGPDPHGTRLHRSVLARAAVSHRKLGRPDLLALKPGQHIDFAVESQREWDRTGLVIEQGATYELIYLAGAWRDATQPPAGPDGQNAKGPLDLRRILGWGRRLPAHKWMLLVGTVAHPREWKPEEHGVLALARLLFVNTPKRLICTTAAFGTHLRAPNDSICLTSAAPSGLLHLFANDWWQTASNNSGALHLRLRRLLPTEAPLHPHWQLTAAGTWQPPAHAPATPRAAP